MKTSGILIFVVTTLLAFPYAQALQSHQKRLLVDKNSKQCFFVESVRKSEKYGWLNEKKAKQISQIKRKKILTASSEVNVRKVFVPKTWCQGT